MFVYVQPKTYGFWKFMGDVFMTFITYGIWLIWIFIREMRKRRDPVVLPYPRYPYPY